MQFEGADDEEPTVPEDEQATGQELEAQARAAYADASLRRRLLKASMYILNATPRLKARCQPEDLLQDALVAVLTGRRAWKKDKVDFAGLIVGTMRSLASSQDASMQSKESHVSFESDLLATAEADNEVSIADRYGHDDTSPEGAMMDAEHDAEIKGIFSIIRTRFGENDLASRIADKMAERRGYMPADIKQALAVGDREFWSAYRRVMRTLDGFLKKGLDK